jgi:hypothetical protein
LDWIKEERVDRASPERKIHEVGVEAMIHVKYSPKQVKYREAVILLAMQHDHHGYAHE